MIKKVKFLTRMLWTTVLPMLFFACESKMDEHYDTPKWLKGSTWEVLESQGNYTIFLQGIERAGFKQIVNGKNIMTVMAPTDEAFKAYLQSKGLSSIEELSQDELKTLIGFHLMYYSYGKNRLINFRPEGDGVTEEQAATGAGLFYKHRTRSSDPIETLNNHKIYHTERFLPVFSYEMFKTKKIDAKSNYEYFYPNSTWSGDELFNVSNASVIGDEIISSNGYVFAINQVLEPLETIYSELKKNDNYSIFLSLYDKSGYYLYDEEASKEYGNGDSLFYYKHESPLVDIACEWPVTSYSSVSLLSSFAYTIFAPSNDALNKFFSSYWKGSGYEKLDDVSDMALKFLLESGIYGGNAVMFPQEVKEKRMNNQEIEIDYDVENLPQENRKMCSNGVLYELTDLKAPAMFTSITGAAFKYKNFSNYLYMLGSSGMVNALSSKEATFTMFMPSNAQVENFGYKMLNDELVDDTDPDKAVISTSTMLGIVNLHTITGGEELGTTGTQVLETNRPWNYWFRKGNQITNSATFNRFFEASALEDEPQPFVTFKEVTNESAAWDNGKVYNYNSEEMFIPVDNSGGSSSLQYRLANGNDENFKYYQFAQLLKKADLISENYVKIGGASPLFFIPTNEAIEKAIKAGRIPGLDKEGNLIADKDGSTKESQARLDIYLRHYIISSTRNSIATYPYVGSVTKGFYETTLVYMDKDNNRMPATLEIIDDGTKLSVRPSVNATPLGNAVEVVDTYDYFPFAYADGCVHFLKDVLTISL